jgi:hypothetical protein
LPSSAIAVKVPRHSQVFGWNRAAADSNHENGEFE